LTFAGAPAAHQPGRVDQARELKLSALGITISLPPQLIGRIDEMVEQYNGGGVPTSRNALICHLLAEHVELIGTAEYAPRLPRPAPLTARRGPGEARSRSRRGAAEDAA